MDKENLSTIGLKLSLELEKLGGQYPVRSDDHDALLYESAIVEEKALDLLVKRDIPKHLRRSIILANKRMLSDNKLIDISQKLHDFYQ
ncbi:MAG: hypothetical protein KAH22_07950 [Thiotrichaceae bacterium]|nr:hypothetical protein [Thiotrichaceae bacterium]